MDEIIIAHLLPNFFIKIYNTTPLQINSSVNMPLIFSHSSEKIKDAVNCVFIVYCSFAKYIFKTNAVEQQIAETIKRKKQSFNLSFVGISPNTDKLCLSNSQTITQEIAKSPMSCNILFLSSFRGCQICLHTIRKFMLFGAAKEKNRYSKLEG